MNKLNSEIYVISPPKIDVEKFIPQLESVLETNKVQVFQLRLKDISDSEFKKIAEKVTSVCHKYGVTCLINDKPTIAKDVGADGVHIGKHDISYEEARKILGDDKIIGMSCYNLIDNAIDAAEKGANYVAFGAMYPTKTKENAADASPDLLDWWTNNSEIPCVAIGGITDKNVEPIVKNGADFIAVVSYIWEHPISPSVGVRDLHQAIISSKK